MVCRGFSVVMAMVWAAAGPLLAAGYTVRDAGFVDQGAMYELLIVVDGTVDPAAARTLGHIAQASFIDANVQARVMPVADVLERGGAVAAYVAELGQMTYPLALLVEPQGQRVMRVDWPGVDGRGPVLEASDEDAVWQAMRAVVLSPLRQRLLDKTIEANSLLILLEGADEAANDALAMLLEEVAAREGDDATLVVRVSRQESAAERVLLWAWGVEQEMDEARVLIVAGRLRPFGTVWHGPQVTAQQLDDYLLWLSQEAALDWQVLRLWGEMVPHRWDVALQAAALRKLGFDGQDESVQAALSWQRATRPSATAREDRNDLLMGYVEVPVARRGHEAGQEEEEAEPTMQTTARPSDRGLRAMLYDAYRSLSLSVGMTLLLIATMVVAAAAGLMFMLTRHERKDGRLWFRGW